MDCHANYSISKLYVNIPCRWKTIHFFVCLTVWFSYNDSPIRSLTEKSCEFHHSLLSEIRCFVAEDFNSESKSKYMVHSAVPLLLLLTVSFNAGLTTKFPEASLHLSNPISKLILWIWFWFFFLAYHRKCAYPILPSHSVLSSDGPFSTYEFLVNTDNQIAARTL